MDLRFIPDDMQFDSASAKERATFVPENYAPSVTSFNGVNSHSNVKLSWDGEDKRRENELVKGRSSKKNEKGEIDYSQYLASSDESEEEEDEVSFGPQATSEKARRGKRNAVLFMVMLLFRALRTKSGTRSSRCRRRKR